MTTTSAYLDEDARQWLAAIEDQKRELENVTPELAKQKRRRESLRSVKGQQECEALIAQHEACAKACEAFVQENTMELFQCVFGVQEGTPVALQDAQGNMLGGLIVSDFTARLLADGTAVFTVSGESLSADILPGLPQSDYLLAQESQGQRFVALS